jgi:hypothetical protein
VLEKVLNQFGYRKKTKKSYQEIKYAVYGSPEDNTQKFLSFIADGHHWVQQRTKEDYQLIGVFFTIVLLIEYKLSQLLISFDTEIENKTLGGKIEVFKDFLKVYVPQEDVDIKDYRNLIAPLKVIKTLRDAMAHDISKSKFRYENIKHISNYVSKVRPDLFDGVKGCKDEDAKSIMVLGCFGLVFSEKIAQLRISIA